MTTMLERLIRIKADPTLIKNPINGICAELYVNSDGDKTQLYSLYQSWPEFSGVNEYPVPHPLKSPEGAYNHAEEDEMWGKDHVYGAARWRLVDHLIAELSKIGN